MKNDSFQTTDVFFVIVPLLQMFHVFFPYTVYLLNQTTGKLKKPINLFLVNMLTKRITIFSFWRRWFMASRNYEPLHKVYFQTDSRISEVCWSSWFRWALEQILYFEIRLLCITHGLINKIYLSKYKIQEVTFLKTEVPL